jgi:hypothetical protein
LGSIRRLAQQLCRWRLKGRFGIRLETFLRGGRRYTTANAAETWFEMVTAAADGRDLPVRTARQQHQAVADAMGKLGQEGM